MSRVKRKHNRDGYQMVPADPITDELPAVGATPVVGSNGSLNGLAPVPQPESDDYWARALGKAHASPAAPQPARANHYRPVVNNHGAANVQAPSDDTAAGYWDRARGAAPRRPVLPERPAAPARPAAAVSVAPEAAQALPVTSEDTVVVPAVLAASEPAPPPTEGLAAAQPESGVRGAHARKEDTLASAVRGSHVKADDPLAGAGWEAHPAQDDALAAEVSGSHVMADDPLAAKFSPAHASKITDPVEVFAATDGAGVTSEAVESFEPVAAQVSGTEAHESAAEIVKVKTRRRRWGVVPVAGAAAALAAGLGAGSAYAYFQTSGSGSGQTTTGTPSNVVLGQATIGTVSSYLVPGGTGDLFVKVNNPNNQPVTITGISQTGGVTVSGGVGSCTSDPLWPGTLGTGGVSVPTNNTLNISVPALSGSSYQVDIPNAASMTTASATGCQSATFQVPVTITVRMG